MQQQSSFRLLREPFLQNYEMHDSKKSKKSGGYDRLSELPDSLIFNIFQYLPLTDVVRTEVLSKRYENLWKTVPFLNFEGFKKKTTTRAIQKLIAWVVMLWRGTKILKLKVDFGTRLNKSLQGETDFLVRFAKNFGVEELDVHLKYVCTSTRSNDEEKKLYGVPRCLYSCSSIKRLHLEGCNLRTPARNVCWNQLKYLKIEAYVLCQDSIDKVLCGSPKLESLMLSFSENHKNLSIQSSSLRYLYIRKYLYYTDDVPSGVTELRISTPKLKELEIVGLPYSKFFIMNDPLLTHAKLVLSDNRHHDLFSGDDFIGDLMKQILPTIQNVKQLELSDWFIKALGDMKKKDMLSPFPNVEELRLYGRLEEYEKAVRVLELCPKLQRLVLEYRKASKKPYGKPAKFKADFPKSFLQKLRTVKATWIKSENSVFRLMKILLKSASKLEKMEIRSSNPQFLQAAEEKVLRMSRSSQNAEFIFSEK